MSQGRAVAKRDAIPKNTPAVVEAIRRPSLEAFERHRGDLNLGFEYDDHEDKGDLVTRRWPPGKVDKYTKLVPEESCRTMIAELDEALAPAIYDQAKALARTVMGRHTKRELYDPDIFVFELTRVFGEAPADLGREAADQLRTMRFLPNVGDVKGVLDGLVRDRELARNQARAHLAEHERRRSEAAKPEPERATCEQIDAILEATGVRRMMNEAAAEKPRPKCAGPVHRRAHDAAMEALNCKRAAEGADGR